MPSPRSRWRHRALAVVAALMAVLTGALLCAGTSTAAATGGGPEPGGPRVATDHRAGGAASGVVVPRAGGAASAALVPKADVPLPVATAVPHGPVPHGSVPHGIASPGDQRVPGCGDGSGDGGPGPAVPPRGSAAHELLPALPAAAHGAAGCPAAAGPVLDLAPGRAPPALAAPGPIDLSVLRV
ncbi:hypothetical protein AB0I99_13065 [Streptomyces spongiicola]|uniref:hypothetical protein n=1 Tax=Streptomyces spongiicola TaxID=1690221 RepID=UPI0033F63EEC